MDFSCYSLDIMDPYAVLGISYSATPDQIKSAFRKLAHKHHPDKGGDAEKFKQISAAYNAIKDKKPAPQQHEMRRHGNVVRVTIIFGDDRGTSSYDSWASTI